jgi:hypothetical protein
VTDVADSATNFAITQLQNTVRDLEARLGTVERNSGAHATTGALQALNNKMAIDIAELGGVVRRVESKMSHITDPKETIALIGAEDLRTIKTHLRQLIVIKQEIDEMKVQLVDMLAAYDLGQASVIL